MDDSTTTSTTIDDTTTKDLITIVAVEEDEIVFGELVHLDEHDVIATASSFRSEDLYPVISCSSVSEPADHMEDCDDAGERDSPIPEAHAIALTSGLSSPSLTCQETISARGYNRAEFSSATVFKPTPTSPVGLFLQASEGKVRIARIDDDGLFSQSNLKVGDVVVSINNAPCRKLNAMAAAHLIQEAVSAVTIIVRHKGGDPALVSSFVAKPRLDSMLGIGLKVYSNGKTTVSRVDAEGLFGNSLLNKGDRCLFINDYSCAHLRSWEIGDLVRESMETVTIITKPAKETAFVVCEEDKKHWLSRLGVKIRQPSITKTVRGCDGSVTAA